MKGFTTDFRFAAAHRLDVGARSRFEFGSGWQSRELSVFLQSRLP
jgi:hypothetical protein